MTASTIVTEWAVLKSLVWTHGLFRGFGIWADVSSRDWPLFSWVTHGIMALPLVGIMLLSPVWVAPGLVFLYRELEQMWHRYIKKQEMDWLDHFMDVAVPTLVGWLLLS